VEVSRHRPRLDLTPRAVIELSTDRMTSAIAPRSEERRGDRDAPGKIDIP
jgi:hypothetical protein